MPAGTTVNIITRAREAGILALEELEDCWDELGTRNVSNEHLLRALERRGTLTPFQIAKLNKGDTSGYFFGANKILYKIASGAFARVYRGINVQTGEPAAVKVLRHRWTRDPASIQAFYHEGEVGEKLRHPNIVRIDEVSGHDSLHYIAMEFVEGGNLRDFLAIRNGRLNRDEAVRLMLHAAGGLAYAFDQGITHRDIKLTNLLASTDGVLKLVDFGLATLHRNERLAEEAHGQRTVEYALLERQTGVPKGDSRSDIFFLGAVFYQMVSGTPPITEKKDRAARLLRTRIDNIRSLQQFHLELDPALASLIDRMMSLDVHRRYQTPHEVVEQLEALARVRPAANTESAGSSPPAATNRQTTSLLFVESDSGLQDTLRAKFQSMGYRVLLTSDPNRALQRYGEQPADCVIVDCETTGMSGLDGFLGMQRLAQNRKWNWSGIILLAADQEPWAQQVHSDQRTVVMIKPTTLRKLRKHVQRLWPIP